MNKVLKVKRELEKELKDLESLEEKVKGKRETLELRDLKVPFVVGKNYLIRTVTYHATGRVKAIVGNFLVLEEAAWIADTGRFRDAILKGILSEVEPVEDMFLSLNSIVDAFPWKAALPREQK